MKWKKNRKTFLLAMLISFTLCNLFTADVIAESSANKLQIPLPQLEPVRGIKEPEPELTSLGEFKLTAYCSCEKCCNEWAEKRPVDAYGNEIIYGSTGEVLKAGYSVAVDPAVIPYGTELNINGKVYKAQDCGGAINGDEIDIYFNDHKEALEFGVQTAEVLVKNE